MLKYILLFILIFLIVFSILILYKKKIINEINNKNNKIIKQKEEEVERRILLLDNELKKQEEKYQELMAQQEEKANLIFSQETEIINKELENYKIKKTNEIETEFIFLNQNLQKEYEAEMEKWLLATKEFQQMCSISTEEAQNSLNKILEELEDYRKRREVVNEAIIREKELQEKENFYKLDISDFDKEDIKLLRTIEPNLKNKEALNKLIYDVFIKKPALEMIKRVLNGCAPSGIYKITYIPTGESYIGKSTNVNKRWQEHLKSAYGLGTIAHSSLHTKMAKEGVWNFTFELLEEIEKDKLSEREKYWIEFYGTKEYGLNERAGG